MMKLRTLVMTTVLATAAAVTPALAVDYTAMRNDKHTHSELLSASIAYLIDENCSELGLRKLRLVNRAFALRNHAKGLGYTTSEVMAYADSETEQDRFRKIANSVLAQKGAVKGQEASYCAVGRAEMQKGTLAGSFLYER